MTAKGQGLRWWTLPSERYACVDSIWRKNSLRPATRSRAGSQFSNGALDATRQGSICRRTHILPQHAHRPQSVCCVQGGDKRFRRFNVVKAYIRISICINLCVYEGCLTTTTDDNASALPATSARSTKKHGRDESWRVHRAHAQIPCYHF